MSLVVHKTCTVKLHSSSSSSQRQAIRHANASSFVGVRGRCCSKPSSAKTQLISFYPDGPDHE